MGQNAGELMEGGPESRGTNRRWAQIQGKFETKNAKNDFIIKDAHRNGGNFATKIGVLVCGVG